jgi:predicted DNA-binding transcriptional regulator AlpA
VEDDNMETIQPGVTSRRAPGGVRKKTLLPLRKMMERYSVSDRTIDRWSEDGILPKPIKIGRLRYWREEELDAFDEART